MKSFGTRPKTAKNYEYLAIDNFKPAKKSAIVSFIVCRCHCGRFDYAFPRRALNRGKKAFLRADIR
ncbi:MAG: hypothetical protein Kow0090_15900 [Myxococcota bacterium]